jgi:microcystin degradation protein MlrC
MTGSARRLHDAPLGRTGSLEKEAQTRKRVLLAGLRHQTNTFVGGRTGLEDFEIARGEEVLRERAYAPHVAGVLEVAEGRGWEVLPVLDARALPGPTVADAVVDLFWAEFKAVADAAEEAGRVDGVFLLLHGSMVSESLPDVEGEVLRRIRGVEYLSGLPVCGVLDPRANFTEAMARQSDGLIAHRENPPVDAKRAARDAAVLLDALMETEERPATVRDHPPVLWTPSGAATDEEPMSSLAERAREIEAAFPDVVAVNVFAGFPYADVPDAGVGFSAVTTGDLEIARAGLRELNAAASFRREEGVRTAMPLEEAMLRLQRHDEGPVLLVEPSDSVLSGAPGDGTRLLRALVEYDVPAAGAVVNDPETVAALAVALPGERREVAIGGGSGELGAEPLPLEVELVSRGEGRFVPEKRHPAWPLLGPSIEVDMGPCSVVRVGGVTILLTSRRTPPIDLGQWRSQGVEPEGLFAIGVKASVEHRRAYEAIAKVSYVVDVPGPCPLDLRRLPYRNVDRPIYPLDEL